MDGSARRPQTQGTRRGLLAALGAAPALAAACGGPAQVTTGGDAAKSTRPVTVSWVSDWNAAERGAVAQQAKLDFERQYPHITIDQQGWQYGGSTYQALSTHLAAGTLVDLALTFPAFFTRFAEQGVYTDIGPHLKQIKYDKGAVFWHPEPFEHKGKTHGVPFQFIIQSWVYNKSLFATANVAPPTADWTLDDLLAAGRRISKPDGSQFGALIQHHFYEAWPWVYANNADLVTNTDPVRSQIDHPKVVEVFQYLVDLIHKHRISPVVQGANAAKGFGFTEGNVAIHKVARPNDTHTAVKERFQMDAMLVPRWPGTRKRSTEVTHQGLMVTRFAKERGREEAATLFATWMGGEPGQTLIARLGGATPVYKKIAYGPLHLDGRVPGLKALLDSLENKGDQQSRMFKIFKGTQEFQDEVSPILNAGFGGDLSVPEMIAQAQRAGQATLDKARSL